MHLLPGGHAAAPGGAVLHVLEMVEALRDQGVDAIAATLEEAPDRADLIHLYALGHAEHQAPAARARWPRTPFALTPIFVPWSLRNVLDARDRHVLVAATKNVVKNRLYWSRCRAVLREADLVFPCSQSEAAMLGRFYRVPVDEHWRVATTGLHLRDWPADGERAERRERASSLGLPEDTDPIVVCAARLEPLKNQRNLMRAVASFPRGGLVLLGGKRKQPYADRVLDHGPRQLGERFRWIEHTDRAGVRAALRQADVFALCSIKEVASIATLEGAVMGCEVVATRSGANEEYYGELVHLCSTSTSDIAAAIAQCDTSPLQPALEQRVRERFDWSTPAAVIAAAYHHTLAASS